MNIRQATVMNEVAAVTRRLIDGLLGVENSPPQIRQVAAVTRRLIDGLLGVATFDPANSQGQIRQAFPERWPR
jgi:hypothetical protein